MALKGALIDCDGTLIDALPAYKTLEEYIMKDVDEEVTFADRQILSTLTLEESAAWFHERFGLSKSGADLYLQMKDYLLYAYEHVVKLMPGVAEFLAECEQAGVKMAVVSSSPLELLEAGLTSCGIRHFFQEVISVDTLHTTKREVGIFDCARKALATPRDETWGFEDSLYALASLRSGGYPTVGIFTPSDGLRFEEWKNHADIVVRSFADIHIGDINRIKRTQLI